MEPGGLVAGAVHVNIITAQLPRYCLSKLRTGAVVGAEKQNAQRLTMMIESTIIVRSRRSRMERITRREIQRLKPRMVDAVVDIARVGTTAAVTKQPYSAKVFQVIRYGVLRYAQMLHDLPSTQVRQSEEINDRQARFVGKRTEKRDKFYMAQCELTETDIN